MLYPIQNNFRHKINLSGIWEFQTDPENIGESENWVSGLPNPRPIAVPASWNDQYEDLFNYFGLGWYLTKTFFPGNWEEERVFIRIGSANYLATVFINGDKVGTHEGGHLPFSFEISSSIKWNQENVIAISVENHLLPNRVPSAGISGGLVTSSIMNGYPSTTFDFFPFAGLHRPVILYSVPQIYIEDITVVTDISGNDGLVNIKTKINTPEAVGKLDLLGGGNLITHQLQFKGGIAKTDLFVPSARLWSDQDPFLYKLTIHIDKDSYTLDIGIRTIKVDGKTLLLNGEPVYLKGFGRHEDFIASGKGLNLPLLVKDYHLMRWIGANSYRTSHYPYSEEEMMLADRQGFLIIDETPAVSLQFDNEKNVSDRYRMCIQQIDEMISRDKNHPSVIMWSVANEPMPPGLIDQYTDSGSKNEDLSENAKSFLNDLLHYVRHQDPTRLATFVSMMGTPLDWQEECDVICLNRYWGWYVQGGQLDNGFSAIDQELDQTWELLKKPILVSEFGTDTQPGLHGLPGVMWTEEYQAEFIRGYLEVASKKDFVVGMHVWNFADFAAVQSVMRVGGMNLKGVFTRSRQPKMAAHVLREFWLGNPQSLSANQGENKTKTDVLPSETLDNAIPNNGVEGYINSVLEALVERIDGKHPGLSTVLKLNFDSDGIYRIIIDNGSCSFESGDGDAHAEVKLSWGDAQKLFLGNLNPIVAVVTGKIKIFGDAKAFMILGDLL